MNRLVFDAEEKELAGLYSSAYKNLHAPQEVYRKVMDMDQNIVHMGLFRKAALIVATLAFVVLGSNLITYAATGTGWIGRIMVAMNSSDAQEMIFEEMVDSYGRTYYFGTIQDGQNGTSLSVSTYDPAVLQGVSFRVDGEKLFVTDADGNEHQIERYDENAGYTAGLAIPTPKVTNPDD